MASTAACRKPSSAGLFRHALQIPPLPPLGRCSESILDTPISPELLPPDEKGNIAQQTEDLVGPYALHDFFLYYVVRFGLQPKKIFQLARAGLCRWHSMMIPCASG